MLLRELLIYHSHSMAFRNFEQGLLASRIQLELLGRRRSLSLNAGLEYSLLLQFLVVFHGRRFHLAQLRNEIRADISDDLGEFVLIVIIFPLVSVRLRWLEAV